MTELLHFLQTMPDWQKAAWFAGCIALCVLLETLIPLARFSYNKLRHDAFNLGLFLFNGIIAAPVVLLTSVVMVWADNQQVGLLYHVDLPVWLELLLAILVLDLVAQYTVHYMLHHVKWMWRLHMVHHADTHVDTTTATRHHPGDLVARLVFAMVTIVAMGIPAVYYLVYRAITPFFGYLTHANIKLPGQLDRLLSFVVVTPDMHKFHHHYQAPWTDSNFGNVFSIWDRVFGTLVYADTADIRYGLDVMDGDRELDFRYQMLSPVDKSIPRRR
ncbi:MAG: sterol desaturase family protein [Halioglobus sp.]|nr:sterol desaturase family protein [Halioglobus sp.]